VLCERDAHQRPPSSSTTYESGHWTRDFPTSGLEKLAPHEPVVSQYQHNTARRPMPDGAPEALYHGHAR